MVASTMPPVAPVKRRSSTNGVSSHSTRNLSALRSFRHQPRKNSTCFEPISVDHSSASPSNDDILPETERVKRTKFSVDKTKYHPQNGIHSRRNGFQLYHGSQAQTEEEEIEILEEKIVAPKKRSSKKKIPVKLPKQFHSLFLEQMKLKKISGPSFGIYSKEQGGDLDLVRELLRKGGFSEDKGSRITRCTVTLSEADSEAQSESLPKKYSRIKNVNEKVVINSNNKKKGSERKPGRKPKSKVAKKTLENGASIGKLPPLLPIRKVKMETNHNVVDDGCLTDFEPAPLIVRQKVLKNVETNAAKLRLSKKSARMSLGNNQKQSRQKQKFNLRKVEKMPEVLIVSDEDKLRCRNKDNDQVIISVEDVLPPLTCSSAPEPKKEMVTKNKDCVPMPFCKTVHPLVLEKSKFLRNYMPIKMKDTEGTYISLTLFSELLSDLKLDLNQLSASRMLHDAKRGRRSKSQSHFLYDKFAVTHVSTEMAVDISKLLLSDNLNDLAIPKFLRRAFSQLNEKEMGVKMERIDLASCKRLKISLSPKTKKVLTSQEMYRNKKKSTRKKHATAKLMDTSILGSNSCLMSSFSEEDSFECEYEKDQKSVTELVLGKDREHFLRNLKFDHQFTGKLRPKYRSFRDGGHVEAKIQMDKKVSKPKPSRLAKQKVSLKRKRNIQLIQSLSDEDGTENEVPFKKPCLIPLVAQSVKKRRKKAWRPCKKFASNDVMQNYLSVYGKENGRSDRERLNASTAQAKVKIHAFSNGKYVNLPRFSLSGIQESKPPDCEGWFVNKICQLKKVANESKPFSGCTATVTQNLAWTKPEINSVTPPHERSETFSWEVDHINQRKSDDDLKSKNNIISVKYSEGIESVADLMEYNRNLLLSIVALSELNSGASSATASSPKKSINQKESKRNPKFELMKTSSSSKALCYSKVLPLKSDNPYTWGDYRTNQISNSDDINLKELMLVAKRVEKVTTQGINRPKIPYRELSFLPPDWMKVTRTKDSNITADNSASPKNNCNEIIAELVSPDGERFQSLGGALKYLEARRCKKIRKSPRKASLSHTY